MLAHWVGARRRELGVRFALGATRASIAAMIVHEALWTAGVGIVVGLAAVMGGLRAAGSALLGVPSLDARATLLVGMGAMALAIAAALGPARRAAQVDIAELLRVQ